jgi:hypothetical protein
MESLLPALAFAILITAQLAAVLAAGGGSTPGANDADPSGRPFSGNVDTPTKTPPFLAGLGSSESLEVERAVRLR